MALTLEFTAPAGYHVVMKLEITAPPILSPSEQASTDLHGLRNVLTSFNIELFLLARELGDAHCLDRVIAMCTGIAAELDDAPPSYDATRFAELRTLLAQSLDCASRAHGNPESHGPHVAQCAANLEELLATIERNLRDRSTWEQAPYVWQPHVISHLTFDLQRVFTTMASLSRGRYGIVYVPGRREPRDYLIEFDISSVDGATITMPPILKEVIRDLTANARKYSEPGTHIRASLIDTGHQVELEVSDEGRGIPPDEMLSVIGYGVRGSNVRDVETRGGGMGLTKAVVTCSRLQGRTWIESEMGRGTTITLHVPRPCAFVPLADPGAVARGTRSGSEAVL